jgi:phage pi2 protein 07
MTKTIQQQLKENYEKEMEKYRKPTAEEIKEMNELREKNHREWKKNEEKERRQAQMEAEQFMLENKNNITIVKGGYVYTPNKK